MFSCKYKFNPSSKTSEGTYGEVSIVEKDNKKYAFKRMKADDKNPEIASGFYDPLEVDILFRMNSPHLVKGVDINVAGECFANEPGVVMEIIDGDLTKDIKQMSYKQKHKIIYDLSLGLKCLHDNKFLHLDIKPDNAMYNKSDKFIDGVSGVLVDYGMASYVPQGVSHGITTSQARITFDFTSPHASKTDKQKMHYYNDKDDIWSLGITFLQILNGNRDFIPYKVYKASKNNRYKELYEFLTFNFHESKIDKFFDEHLFRYISDDINVTIKSQISDLLKNMLHLDESKRFNIQQVVNHLYFKQLSIKVNSFCEIKKQEMYSLKNVKKQRITGVTKIIQICKAEIPDKPLDVLFMAIDIYLRLISQTSEDILDIMKNDPELLCILIASKYYYWSDLSDFDEEIDLYVENENLIYKMIKGLIRDERYLSNCKNLEEAKFVFNTFLNPKNNTQNVTILEDGEKIKVKLNSKIYEYLEHDGKKFMDKNRDTSNKKNKDLLDCTISDLV